MSAGWAARRAAQKSTSARIRASSAPGSNASVVACRRCRRRPRSGHAEPPSSAAGGLASSGSSMPDGRGPGIGCRGPGCRRRRPARRRGRAAGRGGAAGRQGGHRASLRGGRGRAGVEREPGSAARRTALPGGPQCGEARYGKALENALSFAFTPSPVVITKLVSSANSASMTSSPSLRPLRARVPSEVPEANGAELPSVSVSSSGSRTAGDRRDLARRVRGRRVGRQHVADRVEHGRHVVGGGRAVRRRALGVEGVLLEPVVVGACRAGSAR